MIPKTTFRSFWNNSWRAIVRTIATGLKEKHNVFNTTVKRLLPSCVPTKIDFQTDNFISIKGNYVGITSLCAVRLSVFMRNDNLITMFYYSYILNVFKVTSLMPAFLKEPVTVQKWVRWR